MIIVLLFIAGMVLIGNRNLQKEPSQEESQEERWTTSGRMINVELEPLNTDLLKESKSSFIMINSENEIQVFREVFSDSSGSKEDFFLYPNEDYSIIFELNGVNEVREIHTAENDGHYYIMSIDYATGDVNMRRVPEQEVLEKGNYIYYINDDGTITISGWRGVDEELDIAEEIDGRKVTAIGNWAFYFYQELTTLKIPDTVTTIGDEAFANCENLSTIEFPDSLTTIGNQAFRECVSLTNIDLPDSLTTIGEEAFDECSSLTDIDLPDGLMTIGECAFYRTGLTDVKIPDSVTMIGTDAFFMCENLRSIELPESVKTFDCNPFLYCENLTQIKVSPEHETLTVIDGVLFNKAEKTIICYPQALSAEEYEIPEGTQRIGKRAFNRAEKLTSIKIPDSVTTMESQAFLDCDALKRIVIPDSVTTIGESVFEHCDGLESFQIPDTVTIIGEKAFKGCLGLESITIPDSVTTIEEGAFYCCFHLTSIEIPASVTEIGRNVFFECKQLTMLVERNSYAEQYAIQNGIPYSYMD